MTGSVVLWHLVREGQVGEGSTKEEAAFKLDRVEKESRRRRKLGSIWKESLVEDIAILTIP